MGETGPCDQRLTCSESQVYFPCLFQGLEFKLQFVFCGPMAGLQPRFLAWAEHESRYQVPTRIQSNVAYSSRSEMSISHSKQKRTIGLTDRFSLIAVNKTK